MNRDDVFAVTQSVIAVIVVIGGGFSVLSGSPHADIVIGVVGVVIGYYFRAGTAVVAQAVSKKP